MGSGNIYIAYCSDTNLVKVGATTNTTRRINQLIGASGFNVELMWESDVIGNHYECESAVKKALPDRMRGEWFCCSVSEAIYVAKSIVAHRSIPATDSNIDSKKIAEISRNIVWGGLIESDPITYIKLCRTVDDFREVKDGCLLALKEAITYSGLRDKDADVVCELVENADDAYDIAINSVGCLAFTVTTDDGVYSFSPSSMFTFNESLSNYADRFMEDAVAMAKEFDDDDLLDISPFEFNYDMRSDKSKPLLIESNKE